MRRVVRDNGLGLAFGGLFLASLIGQAFAGLAQFNEQQVARGAEPVSLLDYLTSSSFAVDVVENWQSEYLQFFLYVFATVWLIQGGSPVWARVGGWRTLVFSRSLGLVMGVIFLLCWGVQSIAGWAAYNSEQLGQHQDPVSWAGYLAAPDFWNRTFQNWQSEMLAVGSMAVLSVYLRQRGSPESKPVGAAHDDTGQTG
jgi:hypothetical protein